MAKIIVHDTGVTVISVNNEDFISLTDIARYKITLSPKKWIDTTQGHNDSIHLLVFVRCHNVAYI